MGIELPCLFEKFRDHFTVSVKNIVFFSNRATVSFSKKDNRQIGENRKTNRQKN